MTFWQLLGVVVGGLLVLYIACRLIFTAWHVTQNSFSTKGRKDHGNT